ncbi:mechanosensitive ion channel family protein [Microbacterium sp. 179-B 1A2 NHS]|uniref:mechanosensitive ion channel family protein n=1 Tax=Microbacterium sp. 179-B 1A2 NHS TaxID=3142383 RepID=UPI0039A2C477
MWESWLGYGIAVAIAVVAAVVIAALVSLSVRLLAKRTQWAGVLVRHARHPFRTILIIAGLWAATQASFPDREMLPTLVHVFSILAIGASAWLLASLVVVVTDVALGRYRIDVPDNRVARRIRTQMLIVRRLAIVLIVIIAIGAVLLTFDAVRAIGASVLASAGIASVVAGLAAQSVLANVFAGLQLVFSDALRVDDVVVAEGEWGRVGEITLSYVVLELWDDRRLVLPCTYFTTTPFENWTRRGSELLGAVEFDLDWRVDPEAMRAHLDTVLAQTSLWDRRASVLQVTDAVGGYVRVRILVTAADAPTLFDLRCIVREAMVLWVQRTMPAGLPVQRVLLTDPEPTGAAAPDAARSAAGLFTGSIEAEQRASTFTNAIPVVTTDPDGSGSAGSAR